MVDSWRLNQLAGAGATHLSALHQLAGVEHDADGRYATSGWRRAREDKPRRHTGKGQTDMDVVLGACTMLGLLERMSEKVSYGLHGVAGWDVLFLDRGAYALWKVLWSLSFYMACLRFWARST